jgi:zinc protease
MSAKGWSAPVETVTSPGGITAWLIADPSVPVVALSFAVLDAGAASDPEPRRGLATLAAGLLSQGAGELSNTAFQDVLRDHAISLNFDAGSETVGGSLRALAEEAPRAAGLLALALTRPRFDTTELERARAARRVGLRNDAQNPRSVAARLWWEKAFPGHAIGRAPNGTDEGLAAITAEELQGFVRTRLSRPRLVVAAAGAINAAQLGQLLDTAFGGLAGTAPPAIAAPPAPANFDLALARLDAPQAATSFGHVALPTDDPLWDAQLVVNRILAGGGFSSRLMEEVREKRGLTYGIGAQIVPYGARSALVLGATSTENARFGETLSVTRDTWRRFGEEGPTATELDDARAYLAGSFPLGFTATPSIARSLVSLRLAGRPADWLATRQDRLDQVDLARAKQAALRLFAAQPLSFAVAGQPAGL